MVFSNIGLIALIPVALLWYYSISSCHHQKFVILLVSTSLFLASGPLNFIVFLISLTLSLAYFRLPFALRSRWDVTITIIILLIINLMMFKYFRFILPTDTQINTILNTAKISIPLGISFYTFHMIAAIIDLRENVESDRVAAGKFSLFCIFFPQLVAGPIARYHFLAHQFDFAKSLRLRNLAIGAHLFALGMVKKVFIADQVARIVDPVFTNPTDADSLQILAAALGFYVQVYADFSGYTDMARGIARLFGYRLPLNFRAPYLTASPVEFWSRWHISLSSWVRDYLYVPLATNAARRFRKPRPRALAIFAIIMAVMVILGLWHGAAWRFILFGAFHGLLIVVWRVLFGATQPTSRLAWILRWALLQGLLVVTFIFFRAPDFATTGEMVDALIHWRGGEGHGSSAMALVGWGTLFIFSAQLVDRFVTRRTVAGFFRFLHGTAQGQILAGGILLTVVAMKLTFAINTVEIAGVSLHAPREQFIYFDF